jgi:hypothetical protein
MGMFHAASTISLVHLAKSLLCSANSVAIELLSAFMILASTRSIPDDAQPFPTRHRQLSSKEKPSSSSSPPPGIKMCVHTPVRLS